MTRRKMDWAGNIVDVEDAPIETVRTTEGTEITDFQVTDPFEQHMANINQDDEDPELTETGCAYETDNLYECPRFAPLEDDDVPDVIECRVCGRFDWKKKESIGKRGAGVGAAILI